VVGSLAERSISFRSDTTMDQREFRKAVSDKSGAPDLDPVEVKLSSQGAEQGTKSADAPKDQPAPEAGDSTPIPK